ncbi:hypothetical protein PA598K_04103 [Paenibacillus sp. 598K]|uniref:S-layer homology domain-containing protein n=1 Tax=Paenibacillus sp. 598K TaxID=1117987 RepID=UPI000FF9E449|nr:S-layer homology domain-containing protein [Paenibacillus sp. 598K]GBF75682.1 hypothetical protein PA598K_04103 [Paenibacillus sp. 598K]
MKKKWLSGCLALLLMLATFGGTGVVFAEQTETPAATADGLWTAEVEIVSPDLEHEGLPFVATVEFEEGANAFDLLLAAVGEENVQYTVHPEFGPFIEGIMGLEGTASDWWMFNVNGEASMVGAGSYLVEDGDTLQWEYFVDDSAEWEVFAFADQDKVSPWAQEATQWLGYFNIMSGKPSGDSFLFDPKGTTTRAEFTKLLVSILYEDPSGAEAAGFTDVAAGAWYADYVNKAKLENLIGGYADNTFKPSATISRQDAAVILARAFELSPSAEAPSFGDVTAAYAKDAIAAIAEAGIMEGYNGAFRPQDSITREELAVVTLRLFEVFGE